MMEEEKKVQVRTLAEAMKAMADGIAQGYDPHIEGDDQNGYYVVLKRR